MGLSFVVGGGSKKVIEKVPAGGVKIGCKNSTEKWLNQKHVFDVEIKF